MGFLKLISSLNNPYKKYFVSSVVFDKHYKAEFIKQVLPRFDNPHKPQFDFYFIALIKGIIKN
jgi:hypothetical protein